MKVIHNSQLSTCLVSSKEGTISSLKAKACTSCHGRHWHLGPSGNEYAIQAFYACFRSINAGELTTVFVDKLCAFFALLEIFRRRVRCRIVPFVAGRVVTRWPHFYIIVHPIIIFYFSDGGETPV
eukprot:5410232-Pleurochrysis_carterae.AAC.3